MEAMRKGDTNNDGKIEVTEFAAYVGRSVPKLSAELKANGLGACACEAASPAHAARPG